MCPFHIDGNLLQSKGTQEQRGICLSHGGTKEQWMNKAFCSSCCSEASKMGIVGLGSSLMHRNKDVGGNDCEKGA